MTPSLLSGAIVCPVRFIHLALFAAMVATVSPFATDSSEVGNRTPAARLFDEVLAGESATATATASLITADALTGTLAGDVTRRYPAPEPVPTPLPSAPRFEGRSPRGSTLNTITIFH